MKRKLFFLLGLTVAMSFMGVVWWWWQAPPTSSNSIVINGTAVPPVPTLSPTGIARGRDLYTQYCASCHGTQLEGALNWKKPLANGSFPPPPHDDSGHTWHHPDFLLLQIMSEGGKPLYDGVMPGFAAQLTQEDMRAILEFLKSHWSHKSREYQWWVTNTYPTPTPNP